MFQSRPTRFTTSFGYGVGDIPEVIFQPTPLSLSGFSFQAVHDPAFAVDGPAPSSQQHQPVSQARQSQHHHLQQQHQHHLPSQPGNAFALFTPSPNFSAAAAYQSSASAAAALTSLAFPGGVPTGPPQHKRQRISVAANGGRRDHLVKMEMDDHDGTGGADLGAGPAADAMPANDIEAQELAAREYQPILEVSFRALIFCGFSRQRCLTFAGSCVFKHLTGLAMTPGALVPYPPRLTWETFPVRVRRLETKPRAQRSRPNTQRRTRSTFKRHW